jgi:hypothetical protein
MAKEIPYDKFDWKKYIIINHLVIKNKEEAWKHWKMYGTQEGTAISLINNSRVHHARFGNLFFINLAIHFICLKNKLKFDYKYYDQFQNLGIDLFIGTNEFKETFTLTDENFFDELLSENILFQNIMVKNDTWCQTREFCLYLREYFQLKKIKGKVVNKNIYKDRYKLNNDVFIHVRLGDIENKWNNSFEYYDKILEKMEFITGYISSDTISSEICQKLIIKYNLNIIEENEEKTIMFASTCNNLILSGGTFSWLIAFLAFYSKNIYYPLDNKNKWYGDIFIFPEWSGIKE